MTPTLLTTSYQRTPCRRTLSQHQTQTTPIYHQEPTTTQRQSMRLSTDYETQLTETRKFDAPPSKRRIQLQRLPVPTNATQTCDDRLRTRKTPFRSTPESQLCKKVINRPTRLENRIWRPTILTKTQNSLHLPRHRTPLVHAETHLITSQMSRTNV